MTHWFAGLLLLDIGYQPRHRSTRQAVFGADRSSQRECDYPARVWDDRPARPAWQAQPALPAPTDASWLAGPARKPDLLDQLTSDDIRRRLENCAIRTITRNIPELVLAIGHSSHTAATLTSAWRDFRQSIRDAYALQLRTSNWTEFYASEDLGLRPDAEAVDLKLRQADEAWWVITNGLP